jgi:hypothetical protein
MAVTKHDRARSYWDERGALLLWLAIVSGPAAWAIHELVAYALVKPVCAAGTGPMLALVSAGTLVLALAGAWIGWSCLVRLRDAGETGDDPFARSHFMAVVGLGLNLLIVVLIAIAAVPPFLLSPCE